MKCLALALVRGVYGRVRMCLRRQQAPAIVLRGSRVLGPRRSHHERRALPARVPDRCPALPLEVAARTRLAGEAEDQIEHEGEDRRVVDEGEDGMQQHGSADLRTGHGGVRDLKAHAYREG